jgi:hypothetical protein
MYFLYVDESGDVGLRNSPTRYFALSGLAVHELAWQRLLDDTVAFRRRLKERYGLKLREEIHAAHFIHNPGELVRIAKSMRLQLLRDVLDFQAARTDIHLFNVVVDKVNKPEGYDVFDKAWSALLQRFHNSIQKGTIPGPRNREDRGLVICDRTDEVRLRALARRLRRYNAVPSQFGTGPRQLRMDLLVEDPVHRDSSHSLFVQFSDVNAYFLLQKSLPCTWVKRKGGNNYFNRLKPCICLAASPRDDLGVVRF